MIQPSTDEIGKEDHSTLQLASQSVFATTLAGPVPTHMGSDVGSDVEVMVDLTQGTSDNPIDPDTFETSVDDHTWFFTIQEEKKENPTYKTKREYWPNLWKLAGMFVEEFKNADFFKTRKVSNLADFKGQIVQHILSLCTKVSKNEVPEKYLSAIRNPYKKNYYFYSKENFITFAVESYKHDRTVLAKRNKVLPNDCIRFYSILTRDVNKEDVERLTASKGLKRSNLDGPMTYTEQIMMKLAVQFNDPNLVFTKPNRALFLSSNDDLNPNDPERISIKRDHKFMMEIWKYCTPRYNHCWQKWTKGTGGGSGAEEDFGQWKRRENTEKFADYAENGSSDMMAYIYMLDKDVGFILNAINEPAPSNTIMEDGDKKKSGLETPTKKRKTAQDKIAETASSFNEMMKSTLQVMKEAFIKEINTDGEDAMVTKQKALHWNVTHINNLNEQIDIIKAQSLDSDDEDAVDRRKTRIGMLNEALDCAFRRLNELNK